jgi:hypothetical protein
VVSNCAGSCSEAMLAVCVGYVVCGVRLRGEESLGLGVENSVRLGRRFEAESESKSKRRILPGNTCPCPRRQDFSSPRQPLSSVTAML